MMLFEVFSSLIMGLFRSELALLHDLLFLGTNAMILSLYREPIGKKKSGKSFVCVLQMKMGLEGLRYGAEEK